MNAIFQCLHSYNDKVNVLWRYLKLKWVWTEFVKGRTLLIVNNYNVT